MNLKSLTRSDWLWQIALILFALMMAFAVKWQPQVFQALTPERPALVSPLAWQTDHFTSMAWLTALVHFCLVGLNLFLVHTLVRRYELIDSLSIFPVFFYLVFSACYPPAYGANSALVASALMVVATINVFDCYQAKNCQIQVFNVFLFTTLAAAFVPALLLILPLLWLSFNWVNPFNFSRLLASIAGILTVVWIFAGLSFLLGRWELLLDCLACLPDYLDFQWPGPWQEMLFLGCCALLFLVAALYRLNKFYSEKNSVRGYLSFLIFNWFVLVFLGMLLSPLKNECLTLSVLPWSVMMGHFFNANDNWASRILLLLLLSSGLFCYFSWFLF